MTDIAQLLSNAADTKANFDFGKPYWEGRDQFAKNDLRDAFQGGLPKTPDGQDDYASMARTLIQKGALEQGLAVAKYGLEQQKLRYGQQAGDEAYPTGLGPPSTSRQASVQDIAPRSQGAQTSPQSSAALPADQQQDPNSDVYRMPQQQAVQAWRDSVRPAAGDAQPQVQPQPQPAPPPLQVAQAPQAAPPTNFQDRFSAARPGQGSDPTLGGLVPGGRTPAQQIDLLSRQITSGNLSQDQAKLNLARIEAIKAAIEPTGPMKEYDKAFSQGYRGTIQDYQAESEAKKTAATEEAKLNATHYAGLVESGNKAQMEIPQLKMLQQQMNDRNFFSGAGEEKNLLYKRLKAAVGIDPDAAVPQEMLRKVVASNVLSSLGALKGMGQMRNAVINMAQTASAAPSNSVPANKLLIEIALRTRQSEAKIADLAQTYKEQNGSLDAAFDKQVTNYYKKFPLFSPREIDNWHRVIGEEGPQAGQSAAQPKLEPGKTMIDGHLYKGGNPNEKANWELRS